MGSTRQASTEARQSDVRRSLWTVGEVLEQVCREPEVLSDCPALEEEVAETSLLRVPGKGLLVAMGRTLLCLRLCCQIHERHFLARKEVKKGTMASAAPCLCCGALSGEQPWQQLSP